MHQTLRVSPDQNLFYRYNPQQDVLALRFEPRFESTRDEPLADLPEVSLSHDPADGKCVGLRIEGVQQLLLRALARDVFNMARPHLEAAGAIAPQPARELEPIREIAPAPAAPPSAAPVASPSAASPSYAKAPAPQSGESQSVHANAGATSAAAASSASSETAATRSTAYTRNQDESDDDAGRDKPKKRRRRRRKTKSTDEPSIASDPSGELPQSQSHAEPPAASDGGSQGRGDGPSADSLADASVAVPATAPDPATDPSPTSALEPASRSSARPTEAAAPPARDVAGAGASEASKKMSPAAAHAARYMARMAEEAAESDSSDVAPSEPAEEAVPSELVEEAAPAQAVAEPAPPPTEATPKPPAKAAAAQDGASGGLSPAFASLGLHPSIGRSIASLGFESPTPIQVQAIPVAITGRDVVGLAQTGTGKTLAFVAPGLHRILADPSGGHVPRMLILAPTRELCVQVAEEAERLAAHTGLRVTMIYGGVGMGPQIRDLERGVDLIVATPGRMLDHLRRGNASISKVQTLVLDEADRMLDMGFLPDVRAILRFMPAERQTLFFTATMPPEIESLSMEFQTDPVKVEIARRKPPEAIDQLIYPVGKHLKTELLVHLLENDPEMKSCLIFTERKVDADVLHRRLRQQGIKVAVMHGDRRQPDRERALADLAGGKVQVLVATNVAARGLDIDDISHVVNYDVPQTVDEYVHRIGRTARAEAEGSAWTFVTVSDEVMVDRIEDALEKKLPRILDPDFNYDVPTPAWAKPSAKDVMAMLSRSQSVADRMRGIRRKR